MRNANPVNPPQPGEIDLTPEMIEAGTLEAREHPLGAPLVDLVRNVYLAMEIERRLKTLALVIASLMLAGCATNAAWVGGDGTKLAADLHGCQVEAEVRLGANFGTLRYRPFSLPELRSECMAAKGWRVASD